MINKKIHAVNVNRFLLSDALKLSNDLYKMKAVKFVKMDEFGYVSGLVVDKRHFLSEVLVRNDLLVEYHCDCGKVECCEHVGALLYHLSNEGVNISSFSNQNHVLMAKAYEIVEELDKEEVSDLVKELLQYSRNLTFFKNKYKDSFITGEISNSEFHLNELFMIFTLNDKIIPGKEEIFIERLNRLIDNSVELIVHGKISDGLKFYTKIVQSFVSFDRTGLNKYHFNKLNESFINFYKEVISYILIRQDINYNQFLDLVTSDLNNFILFLSNTTDLDMSKSELLVEFIKNLVNKLSLIDPDFKSKEECSELHYYFLELTFKLDESLALVEAHKNLDYYKVRLFLVKYHVKKGDINIALDLLESGVRDYFHKDFLKPLLQIYQRYEYSKYIDFLYDCYIKYDPYNEDYYSLLNSSIGFTVEKLLGKIEIEGAYPREYLDLLVRNGMYEKLITCLHRSENFNEIVHYTKYLIIDHNLALLQLFEEFIIGEYNRHVDVELIKEHINHLSKIPNSDLIVSNLKEKLRL